MLLPNTAYLLALSPAQARGLSRMLTSDRSTEQLSRKNCLTYIAAEHVPTRDTKRQRSSLSTENRNKDKPGLNE